MTQTSDFAYQKSHPSIKITSKKTQKSKASGPWLTAHQVAEYLGISSHGAVRELERRGVLPGHRLGGSLRFSLLKIDEMLIQSRRATVDEFLRGTASISVLNASNPLGPLMTPEEAAEYLGLPSSEAVNMRAYRGQLPVYKIGERINRFRAEELDAALFGNDLTSNAIQPNLDSDVRLQEREGGN